MKSLEITGQTLWKFLDGKDLDFLGTCILTQTIVKINQTPISEVYSFTVLLKFISQLLWFIFLVKNLDNKST